jgi:hypothetical protein
MKMKPQDARFLAEHLKLPIQLKQRLERVASHDGDLTTDDTDRLLEYSRQRLQEIGIDENNKSTLVGLHLEKLIEKLIYE